MRVQLIGGPDDGYVWNCGRDPAIGEKIVCTHRDTVYGHACTELVGGTRTYTYEYVGDGKAKYVEQ